MFIFNKYQQSFNFKDQQNINLKKINFNFTHKHNNSVIHLILLIFSFNFFFFFYTPILNKNKFNNYIVLDLFLLIFLSRKSFSKIFYI